MCAYAVSCPQNILMGLLFEIAPGYLLTCATRSCLLAVKVRGTLLILPSLSLGKASRTGTIRSELVT